MKHIYIFFILILNSALLMSHTKAEFYAKNSNPPITATTTVTNVSCFNGSNGTATVSATGSSNYSYLWSNGQTSQTATRLRAGIYSVTVTSGNQSAVANATVLQPNSALIGSISTPIPISCSSPNVRISASASGGNPPYSYLWLTNETTSSISVNTEGPYQVIISDQNGCYVAQSTRVIGNCIPPITATTTTTQVSCFGGSNGTATVSATGGSNYSYRWSNGQTTQTATRLLAGTYSVTVTSGNQSTVANATVLQPNSVLIGSISTPTPISCSSPNVRISASASGGNPPYSYLWSTNETNTSISVNTEGIYQVIISDNSGCYVAQSTRVIGKCISPITATTTATQVSCFGGSNGTATVSATGGSNYSYRWSNGQTTQTATRLLAGTYSVTVTSGNQSAVANATVLQPNSVLIGSISTPTPISCSSPNVRISASASGGNPPYSYLWSTNETNTSISVNTEGIYQVIISDNSGCYVAQSTRVIGKCISPITATTTTTQVSCFGGSNGTATVSATGGSNYSYRWSNGQTSQTATRLLAGTYSVTVTSGNQSAVANATVLQPNSVLIGSISTPIPISCSSPNIRISASASGGSPPYSYLWSTNETNTSISVNTEGIYQVIISDNSGCYVAQSTRVIGKCISPITATTTTTQVSCFGGSNGTATVSATGGSNYSYRWSNGQTTQTATRLLAGTYSVTVTSGNQSAVANATVLQPNSVLIGSISTPIPISCTTPNIRLSASASGGSPPYFYLWSNNETTTSISINTEGPYQVIISDQNGCYVAQSARVITNIPTKPVLTIVDNVLPSLVGTISAKGCGTGTVVEYAINTEGPYSTTQPSYTTTPITVYARCRDLATGCVSPSVTKTTKPTQLSSVLSMSCPATINRTVPTYTRDLIVNYPLPTTVSTCTYGAVNMARTQGLASGSAFPVGITNVCYTAIDACGNLKSCCFNVNIYTSSNVSTRSVNSILSPNPANDKVNLTYDFPTITDITVEVKAASGQVIERHILKGITAGSLDIQTETWDNGLYFVTLQNEAEIQVKKLLILH